jgi:hypothetical protein
MCHDFLSIKIMYLIILAVHFIFKTDHPGAPDAMQVTFLGTANTEGKVFLFYGVTQYSLLNGKNMCAKIVPD